MAVFHTLEALDAGGGRALVDRPGKRSGDLLRVVCGTLRVAACEEHWSSSEPPGANPKRNGDARMLEATSYGLTALGVILVAAFCFIWVEEKAALQANRSPRLVEGSKINPLRNGGVVAVNQSGTEPVGREELTGLVRSTHIISPAQARLIGFDTDSLLRER